MKPILLNGTYYIKDGHAWYSLDGEGRPEILVRNIELIKALECIYMIVAHAIPFARALNNFFKNQN